VTISRLPCVPQSSKNRSDNAVEQLKWFSAIAAPSRRRDSMLTLRPLDAKVPINDQLGDNLSPVILINVFTVESADVDALSVQADCRTHPPRLRGDDLRHGSAPQQSAQAVHRVGRVLPGGRCGLGLLLCVGWRRFGAGGRGPGARRRSR
jgi:hypothetical protein